MKFILSIAAGVTIAIVGLAVLFWLISAVMGRFFPLRSGRAHLKNTLIKLGVNANSIDPEIIRATVDLAWQNAAPFSNSRAEIIASFMGYIEHYARVLRSSQIAFVDEALYPFPPQKIYDQILKGAERNRRSA